jgi:hypothetical protein
MSVIATCIEPHGVTRIFFDCVPADPDPRDVVRISDAITRTAATTKAAPTELPRAA